MFTHLKTWLATHEKGQDLSEYALLIGLIALVVVGVVRVLGGDIQAVFTAISTSIAGWGPFGP
jgi:Flp pilus assembly pilin Flp